ncbi:MAG: hypothetical protein HZY79_02860 [Rhodoblastus sp.]|nr:MAG: hypothetical protein HZY79_02860 [Rhodoblastus sp.]
MSRHSCAGPTASRSVAADFSNVAFIASSRPVAADISCCARGRARRRRGACGRCVRAGAVRDARLGRAADARARRAAGRGRPATPTRRQERARRRAAAASGAGVEAAIVDRTLSLNGSQSRLELERREGKLFAAKLQLVGVASDGSGKACRVDLAARGPIEAKELGKETGLTRYELPAEGCAMSFSALNGAVLMKGPGQACVFAKEACRSDVTGMWGPPAASVARSARHREGAQPRRATGARPLQDADRARRRA